jgi:large subunit ribosomal protein L6
MSRIGIRPIEIPSGVDFNADNGFVTVKGPKGELSRQLNREMVLTRENGTLTVSRPGDERMYRQLHGLTRTLIANMVQGVTAGYRKDLEIQGVGYRAALEGKTLVMNVGFSHPVRVDPPEGITFVVDTPTRLAVVGIDKEQVGEEAARLRRVRPPEPYKGKGIRDQGEKVRRKAGKAGKVGK